MTWQGGEAGHRTPEPVTLQSLEHCDCVGRGIVVDMRPGGAVLVCDGGAVGDD